MKVLSVSFWKFRHVLGEALDFSPLHRRIMSKSLLHSACRISFGIAFVAVAAGCPHVDDHLNPLVPVLPAVPTSMNAIAGDNQRATAGEFVPVVPKYRVASSRGEPAVGVTVQFSASAGSTVGKLTATTDANGDASPGSWKLGPTIGEYRLTATVNSGNTKITASVSAVAEIGAPSVIGVASGDKQTGPVTQTLANDIVATVTDAAGNPVPGATVSFAAASGGQAQPSAAATNALGRATTRWTLSSTVGTQQLTASIAGTQSRVVFNATATAQLAHLEIVTQPAASALALQLLTRAPVVRAINANGSVISGQTISVAVEGASNATVTSGSNVTLGSDGQARFANLSLGFSATLSWFNPVSALVRLRFESTNLAPIYSDTIRLSCYAMTVPLDRPFTNAGTLQPGDCILSGQRAREFVVDVPQPAGTGDNAINLLIQQTATTMPPMLVATGAGALNNEPFSYTGAFGVAARVRLILGAGLNHLAVLGDAATSLVGRDYTISASVQPENITSPCTGDQTFIPAQSPLSFVQELSTADCRTQDRTIGDRYGIVLPPGVSANVTIEALGTAVPNLTAYLFGNGASGLNSGLYTQLPPSITAGRTSRTTFKNTDVTGHLYSFAVTSLDPASVGRYRVRVSFDRP